MTQTKTQQSNPQIFTIWSDEIKGRIDPYFFSAEIKDFRNKLSKTKTVKLGEIIEVITKGETPLWRGDDYQNEGVPFLKVQKITPENRKGKIVYISEKVDKRMKRSQLFGGELLYTMAGSIGIATIFPENFGRANINQAIAKIVLKSEINKKYIKIMLNSDLCKKQAEMALTAVAQPNINFEQIKSIKIPLPSLPIQNKIVSIMSKAYEEKKRKEIKAGEILNSVDDFVLKELGIKMPEIEKEMVFEVWSDEVENGRIDPYFYSSIFMDTINLLDNLKTETIKLGEVVEIFSGARPKGGVGNILEGIPSLGGEHVLSSGEIKTEKLKFIPVDFHRSHLDSAVKINDVLLVKDGATTGKVGIIPKNYPYKDCNINEHVFAIRIKDKKIIPKYIFAFLNSGLGQSQIKREITGATVTGLTRESVKNLQIPILPLNIQKKISEKIELYYSQSKTLQKEAKEVLENAKEKVEKMILK